MSFSRIKRLIINGIYVLIGVVLITISINSFFLKLKIAPGGVSGLATVIYYLTNTIELIITNIITHQRKE
jgi:uncharacterized membrane-anchored protein YitT (DUF2179 family)